MARKTIKIVLSAALAAALLCGVGALAVVPDPNPPVPAETLAQQTATVQPPVSEEPSGEASDEASAEAEPLPVVAGTYEGSDGSTLQVKQDGTATYESVVSGKVNGKPMSGRLTFHGTLADDGFSFTKVTFFGLDLTKIAASLGYTDASYWEEAAGIIYADALSK